MKSELRLVREYPHARRKVWRALIMGPGWRSSLRAKLPRVLSELLEDGTLRPGSKLESLF